MGYTTLRHFLLWLRYHPSGCLFISYYLWMCPSPTELKNTYLHGHLQEEVYMEQPPGFVAQGEYGRVCKLCKSLYGLKQSPLVWFRCFSVVLTHFGLQRSSYDHSISLLHHLSDALC